MTIAAINAISPASNTVQVLRQVGGPLSPADFQHGIRAADTATDVRDKVRDAASQFVSSAFVLPVLNALRESPFNDGPFAPGAGERRFGPLLDQHLADEITSGANFSLIDSVVERAMRTTAASAAYDRDGANHVAH